MIMWKILAAIAMSIGVLWAGPKPKPSELTMQSIFTDNMVLQREVAVPIWGTAPARTKVTVTFGQQKKTVETDSHGKWMLKLDPKVKQLVAVRYAFGNAVFGPMLYNKAGLPASPFESKPK